MAKKWVSMDLEDRMKDLEDEVDRLYVSYFESPDEDEFDGKEKVYARQLRFIRGRIDDMLSEVS